MILTYTTNIDNGEDSLSYVRININDILKFETTDNNTIHIYNKNNKHIGIIKFKNGNNVLDYILNMTDNYVIVTKQCGITR